MQKIQKLIKNNKKRPVAGLFIFCFLFLVFQNDILELH